MRRPGQPPTIRLATKPLWPHRHPKTVQNPHALHPPRKHPWRRISAPPAARPPPPARSSPPARCPPRRQPPPRPDTPPAVLPAPPPAAPPRCPARRRGRLPARGRRTLGPATLPCWLAGPAGRGRLQSAPIEGGPGLTGVVGGDLRVLGTPTPSTQLTHAPSLSNEPTGPGSTAFLVDRSPPAGPMTSTRKLRRPPPAHRTHPPHSAPGCAAAPAGTCDR